MLNGDKRERTAGPRNLRNPLLVFVRLVSLVLWRMGSAALRDSPTSGLQAVLEPWIPAGTTGRPVIGPTGLRAGESPMILSKGQIDFT